MAKQKGSGGSYDKNLNQDEEEATFLHLKKMTSVDNPRSSKSIETYDVALSLDLSRTPTVEEYLPSKHLRFLFLSFQMTQIIVRKDDHKILPFEDPVPNFQVSEIKNELWKYPATFELVKNQTFYLLSHHAMNNRWSIGSSFERHKEQGIDIILPLTTLISFVMIGKGHGFDSHFLPILSHDSTLMVE
eukprot:TRINITY_DN7027_c2_g1_i1.p1 TRINITY_DN7027_c2_g1~~TRINITY_DN7027_c2_g1_i1.p1  ORF type:complete len:188 (+),score=24.13 TRINITY_DN7027_c2_g1_i1:220-783(+)